MTEYNLKTFYYGTLKPLEKGFFEQDKVNPYGISSESAGICLTSSPDEAFEVYAMPPYQLDSAELDFFVSNGVLKDKMSVYSSEWFSKALSISEKDNSAPTSEANYKYIELKKTLCEESSPTLYVCTVETYNPFIVSNHKFIDISKLTNVRNFVKCDYSYEKYIHPMALLLFNNSKEIRSIEHALRMTNEIFENFSNKCLKEKKSNPTTEHFYSFLQKKFEEIGMAGKHGDLFKNEHDSIIISNVGNLYANSKKYESEHIIVFNVNKINFKLANKSNADLIFEHQLNEHLSSTPTENKNKKRKLHSK